MAALLRLESMADEEIFQMLPQTAIALRDRGLYWDISHVSFRRSWLVTVLETESARFFWNNNELIRDMPSDCKLENISDMEILKWRGALVQLIRRLFSHKPKPVRILRQQAEGAKLPEESAA